MTKLKQLLELVIQLAMYGGGGIWLTDASYQLFQGTEYLQCALFGVIGIATIKGSWDRPWFLDVT